MFGRLKAARGAPGAGTAAVSLYAAVVERARAPVFFAALDVPDTLDGRFDMMALHAWLVLAALKSLKRPDLEQAFTDTLFVGFDEAFREMGAGDMGMGRKMKKLANAFYGRLSAYQGAAYQGASYREEGGDDALAHAVARNIYRIDTPHDAAHTLARYARAAFAPLAAGDLAAGRADFGPLPSGTP